jgi:hypothetical protein
MSLAFLIVAHKGPGQVGRLVRRIEGECPTAHVYVHVAKDSDLSPFAAACEGTTAQLLERRESVHWGGFSLTRATLSLAARALETDFSHAVLLSGQCYPIRPLRDLEAFLAQSEGVDFIDVRHAASEWPEVVERYEEYHFRDWADRAPLLATTAHGFLTYRLPTRRVPGGMDVYAGATWWALSRPAVKHVLKVHKCKGRLRRFFSRTMLADEMYVHTILGNSSRRDVIQPTITYHRFDHGYSKEHPRIWTMADVAELEASGKYIARKFDEGVDRAVLDYFDARSMR